MYQKLSNSSLFGTKFSELFAYILNESLYNFLVLGVKIERRSCRRLTCRIWINRPNYNKIFSLPLFSSRIKNHCHLAVTWPGKKNNYGN